MVQMEHLTRSCRLNKWKVKMTPNLTPKELAVFEALKQNAEAYTGGDFACAEEVNTRALGLSKQAFGGLLTTIAAKGLISVDITYVNGGFGSKGTKVTQVTFYESGKRVR